MARYTGPTTKISRRFGVALFGSSKALERRNFPPGQHGLRAGRKKKSDYSVALGEKQKLRFQYGVLEKQFRGYYEEAARQHVNHGHVLVNGKRVDIASYQVKPGDKVKIAAKPSAQQLALRMIDLTQSSPLADWLTLDKEGLEGTISRIPDKADIAPLVNEQLIVELYSR